MLLKVYYKFTILNTILRTKLKIIMKEQETIDKFIQLRAEGKSFDKIVKIINVSKPTLLAWERKYQTSIDDLKTIRYESILEKQKVTQEERITRLAKELSHAWEVFEQKDYENLSKRELLLMIMRLEKGLREETAMLSGERKKVEVPEEEQGKIIRFRSNLIEGDGENSEPGETVIIWRVNKDKSTTPLLQKVYRGTKAEIDEMIKKDLQEQEEQEQVGSGQ